MSTAAPGGDPIAEATSLARLDADALIIEASRHAVSEALGSDRSADYQRGREMKWEELPIV